MKRWSRRDFLALSLATWGLWLPACDARHTPGKKLARAKVLVAGGGFGGLNAARALKRLAPELDVTLIDRRDRYTACPGSNQVLAGLHPFGSLAHDLRHSNQARGIAVRIGEIVAIAAQQRTVTLADGSALPYDRLLLAPGIDFRWDRIEGYGEAASHTLPHAWQAGEQTVLLARQLRALRAGGTVVITVPEQPYRCPPGPYERASLIAYFLKHHNPRAKILILDANTRFAKQPAFMHGWQTLYPSMIEWLSAEREGKIDRIDVRNRIVHTEFNTHAADVLNVIPPQRAGKLAELGGLTDATGWCPIDPLSFESTRQSGIHVIGDACTATPMPKSAFSAQSQARHCAAAIIALLEEREPPPPRLINHCYSFLDPGHAISVTGVYGYQPAEQSLKILSGGESVPGEDWVKEADYASDWHSLLVEQTFG